MSVIALFEVSKALDLSDESWGFDLLFSGRLMICRRLIKSLEIISIHALGQLSIIYHISFASHIDDDLGYIIAVAIRCFAQIFARIAREHVINFKGNIAEIIESMN